MLAVVVVALCCSAALVAIDLWSRLPRRVPIGIAGGDGPFSFPPGFVWGAATADHQIERAQPDNWTQFELDARTDRRGRLLDRGVVTPGHIGEIDNVPAAWIEKKADFDTFFADDLRRARELGHSAHRFSISWARLFPRAGLTAPDEAGVRFYDRVFDALGDNGLQPFVTLFHFASPQWLWDADAEGKRGLERRDAVDHFARFVDAVMTRWGSRIANVCTINEPMVVVYSGYVEGTFPPLEQRPIPAVVDVVAQLLRMHASAWRVVKRHRPELPVGIAHHVRRFLPFSNANPLDRLTAHMIERAFSFDFLDAIASGVLRPAMSTRVVEIPGLRGTMDYVGINYYGRFYVKSSSPGKFQVVHHDENEPHEDVTDVGWAIDESSFAPTLQRFGERYRLPLHVLENGIADDGGSRIVDDLSRQRFLVRHVRAVHDAIAAGVDVRSYFFWSLVDNFEWALGFGPRFGLFHTNYDTGERTPRQSVEVFREIARNNGISPALWDKHRR